MARMTVREMWKAKIEGRSVPSSGTPVVSLQRSPFAGRVLGVDPSLRGTGLALVEFVPGRPPLLLRCQTVRGLEILHEDRLLERHVPDPSSGHE